MALVNCPDCGAQVGDTSVVCPQCGFPLRPDALVRTGGGGGGGSSSTTLLIVLAVVGAGFVGIVVIGILAALAIPRFTMASQRAKEKEGEGLLKQAFTLENAYYANNGAYAPTMEDLKVVGWEEPVTLHYTMDVRLGPGENEICLEARPKRGEDVQPLSMDSAGVMYHDEGCTGETVAQSRTSPYAPQAAENRPGEGGDAGARTLLREVYAGVAEYRAKNGRNPTQLSEVLRHVHDSRASTESTLAVASGEGYLCVSAAPRTGEAGRHELSVDAEGRLYRTGTCTGPVLEQFDGTVPGDSASAKPGEKTPS
jgi:Tfp pilus assembly protein PilE